MDCFYSLRSLRITRIYDILDDPNLFHVLQNGGKKGRNNSHSTKATICFNGLDLSKELAVVGMAINAIFMVLGEKAFMQRDDHHDTLYLGIM
jgi:hypothetical protein